MTTDRDVTRALDLWLAEGSSEVSDHVLDLVEDRIARQRQRPAWLLRRSPAMNSYLKIAAGLAAALVVAVIAWRFLPSSGGVGGDPTPMPSPSPTATTIPPLPEGTVTAGTYRLHPFASPATVTVDATVPEGGWLGGPSCCIAGPNGDSNGPNGVVVAFLGAETINSDPCHWDKDGSGNAPQDGDIEVGPTVDDLAAALAAGTAYESTTPVDATLGGFSGKRLELQLAPDASGCDSYDGAGNQYFVFGGRDGGFYAQGGANRWQITIVDVDGTRLISVLLSYSETSAADLSAAQAILDSVVITP
jgi:hypothetical protein